MFLIHYRLKWTTVSTDSVQAWDMVYCTGLTLIGGYSILANAQQRAVWHCDKSSFPS